MSPRIAAIKNIAIIAALLGLAGYGIVRSRDALRTGEEGAKIWFYDESEKRLYAAPSAAIPPHKGIGGESGDGVRAIVVTLGGEAAPKRIAYLQTYAPPLKSILDNAAAAHAAGKPFAGQPSPESDFFISNTLVRAEEDALWHPLNSPEGRKASSQWRSWRGPQGEPPSISVP